MFYNRSTQILIDYLFMHVGISTETEISDGRMLSPAKCSSFDVIDKCFEAHFAKIFGNLNS